MSDEEVIKRRLLFDGDGTGDDRRLNLVLKTLAKWVAATDETPLESQQTYDKILAQVSLIEHSRKRSQLLANSNEKQMTQYQELHKDYENKIEQIMNDIDLQKDELEKAKVVKQNKIQYDLLAKSIEKEPPRKETMQKLVALQAELKELGEVKNKYDQLLDQRRKQFYILSTSSNMLHSMIEDEEKNEQNSMNTSLDDITNSPGPEPMSE